MHLNKSAVDTIPKKEKNYTSLLLLNSFLKKIHESTTHDKWHCIKKQPLKTCKTTRKNHLQVHLKGNTLLVSRAESLS